MTKRKVLVTGSCGFIFSNFIRKALYEKADYQFVSVDKVVQPANLHNVYANKSHTFYMADVADSHFMNLIFSVEKPDIVIHGAAESFVDDAIKDPIPFVHSNVLGTQVLVNTAIKHGVERFIYISTDEVYGHLASEHDKPWTEDAPMNPRNPYSASKAAGEMIVKAANHTHGLQYNITRSCNNFGPRQPSRNLIPKIIKSIFDQQEMPIYGQGKQLREWLHVDDNCGAILTILNKAPANEIYNISSGAEFSNVEVFHQICETFAQGHGLLKFVSDRPGHDFRYSVDSTKMRELGWKPNLKFKQGLAQACYWYEKNRWFLK